MERQRERRISFAHYITNIFTLSLSFLLADTPSMDISFGTKFFEQLCKCAQGNAQYSMEMDWGENGLIKDRWHEC